MYNIIYKVKNSKPKSIIIADNYLDIQVDIEENIDKTDLTIIKRNIPISFFFRRGIIMFDAHLRLASMPIDIKKINNYRGKNQIILIAHPVLKSWNAYNKLKNKFYLVDLTEE